MPKKKQTKLKRPKKVPARREWALIREKGRKPRKTPQKVKAVESKKEAEEIIQPLRGFKDILPIEAPYFELVEKKLKELAESYGYSRIEVPIVESANLFKRTVGKQTDIIQKEMFEFEDRGGEAVALRPEATASVARAYINQGMVNLPQPVKLYYTGPMFRYDRPQTGRQREFHQLGFEAIGDEKPVLDAQLLLIAYNFCKELGLEVSIEINSIGCYACRHEYINELVGYYKWHKSQLCGDCKKRLIKNPLRLLDCKEEKCGALSEGAPQTLDYLDEECKNHFMKVLEFLDELEIPYNLNPRLVRGMDYYNRTVFELYPSSFKEENRENKSQAAIAGGGRFDGLIEILGGRPTPGAGFALGIERLINSLRENGITPPETPGPDVFLAQLGEAPKRRALVIFENLRKQGFKVIENFTRDGLRAQLEAAGKRGVNLTLILGQKEMLDKTILIRDMETGGQEIVEQKKLVDILKKRAVKTEDTD